MSQVVAWMLAQGGTAEPPSIPGAPAGPGAGSPVAGGTTGAGPATGQTAAPSPGGATTVAPSGGTPGPGPRAGLFDSFSAMLPLLGVVLLMFVIMSGGSRREKKRRETMLAALKKGDRVVTTGGMIGTVVEVRETEVVLKADENSNTRLRFERQAVASLREEKPEKEAAAAAT